MPSVHWGLWSHGRNKYVYIECMYPKSNTNDDTLKCSQYKNDAIQLKNLIILKLPPFTATYTVKEKRRQFQT